MTDDQSDMSGDQRRAAARALQREWDWSNPRCPISDIQHPPDEHLPECRLDDEGWLQLADITLNSGRQSSFKIECDDLTDDEVAAACALLVKVLPPFGSVSGVPTGGLRLEEAMRPFVTAGPLLIIDDVWTSGGSVKRHWVDIGSPPDVVTAVLFARGSYPVGVTALFTLDSRLWSL